MACAVSLNEIVDEYFICLVLIWLLNTSLIWLNTVWFILNTLAKTDEYFYEKCFLTVFLMVIFTV